MKGREKQQKGKVKLPKIRIKGDINELAGKAANVLGFVNAAIETVENIKQLVKR